MQTTLLLLLARLEVCRWTAADAHGISADAEGRGRLRPALNCFRKFRFLNVV